MVILASAVCNDYLCDFAATGFVLDPAGDPGPCGPYCDRCGRKMAAEYCEKIEPGWTFQLGKIYGELAERPPAVPRGKSLLGAWVTKVILDRACQTEEIYA